MAVDLTVLTTDYGDGGVERMLVNTVNGLTRAGVTVHYLVGRTDGAYLNGLDAAVEVRELRATSAQGQLETYLRSNRPRRLMTGKLRDDALAAAALGGAGTDTRLYFRVGNPLVHRLRQRVRDPLRRWLGVRKLRRLYALATDYIAISPGVAEDLVHGLGVPGERIHLLPNPVVTADLFERARESVDHPWLAEDATQPVIMGAGGLRQQKDFTTLIKAFARLRATHDCRLMILGRGRQRNRLLGLADRLGVSDHLQLPGWVPNPHGWIARADLFALSSRWEGFGNVLVEAAALGTPVVATDCESGPRYILQNGRYGALVPVGDSAALAAALARTLESPPSREDLGRAAAPFTQERSTDSYLKALGLSGGT